MARVIVTYESGRTYTCDVDACGSGDADGVCAASLTIELTDEGLIFEPSVLPWSSGIWCSPSGLIDEWSSSTPGFRSKSGKCFETQDGSAYSMRGMTTAPFPLRRYVLLTSEQLEDATEITIDGILAYSREGQTLVPTSGGFAPDALGTGMVDDFATLNRPSSGATCTGLSHSSQTDSLGLGR